MNDDTPGKKQQQPVPNAENIYAQAFCVKVDEVLNFCVPNLKGVWGKEQDS